MEKATYEAPEDVFNITDFYWDDYEIQLRAKGLRVFRAKAGSGLYEELEKIIVAISPDRIRAYNWVNIVGSHYELLINFPKQAQTPFEEIHYPHLEEQEEGQEQHQTDIENETTESSPTPEPS